MSLYGFIMVAQKHLNSNLTRKKESLALEMIRLRVKTKELDQKKGMLVDAKLKT